MNRWTKAAIAVSFSACAACSSSHSGSSSSKPEDMTIPEKLNFTAPKEGPDKAKTDEAVKEYLQYSSTAGGNLDLGKAITNVTRTAETDSTKEKEYQDEWAKESDLTKTLAATLKTQVGNKDCFFTKSPTQTWETKDFKAGQTVSSTGFEDLAGDKCSVKMHSDSKASTSVKSITNEPGNSTPTEYSAFATLTSHQEGRVVDKSLSPASFAYDYSYSGPMRYKQNEYYDIYFKGTYAMTWTPDGKAPLKLNCSMDWLVKSLGLTSDPSYNYDYVMNCTFVNQEGKSIPVAWHVAIDRNKKTTSEFYIAGRSLDISALAASLAQVPKPETK